VTSVHFAGQNKSDITVKMTKIGAVKVNKAFKQHFTAMSLVKLWRYFDSWHYKLFRTDKRQFKWLQYGQN